MGMNPDTNKLEALHEGLTGKLLRPDGSEVPKHWSTFKLDEHVVVKGYTFRVAYIGESNILLEPVGPVVVGDAERRAADLTGTLADLQGVQSGK